VIVGINEELAVAESNSRFYEALQNADLSAMEEVWFHGDWVKCVHPGWELIVGWEAIRDSWKRIFESAGGMRVTAKNVRIQISGTVAWVCCAEHLAVFRNSSSAPISAETVATNLFHLVEGSWLMVLHHASPTPDVTLPVQSNRPQ
jgi:ketosteroid isomerase-like protein